MRPAYPLRFFLDCSTAHLSPAARFWLDGGQGLVASTPHGWFVWCEAEPDEQVPADLAAIMRDARDVEAEYILFDADAPEIAALPVFDWSEVDGAP